MSVNFEFSLATKASNKMRMYVNERKKIALFLFFSVFSYLCRLPWYQLAPSCLFFFHIHWWLRFSRNTLYMNKSSGSSSNSLPTFGQITPLNSSSRAATLFSSFDFTKIATWENVFNEMRRNNNNNIVNRVKCRRKIKAIRKTTKMYNSIVESYSSSTSSLFLCHTQTPLVN